MDEGVLDEAVAGMAPEWSPIIKNMAEECKTEIEKHHDDLEAGFKLPPLDSADKVCHPKYGFALMCSMKHLIAVSL